MSMFDSMFRKKTSKNKKPDYDKMIKKDFGDDTSGYNDYRLSEAKKAYVNSAVPSTKNVSTMDWIRLNREAKRTISPVGKGWTFDEARAQAKKEWREDARPKKTVITIGKGKNAKTFNSYSGVSKWKSEIAKETARKAAQDKEAKARKTRDSLNKLVTEFYGGEEGLAAAARDPWEEYKKKRQAEIDKIAANNKTVANDKTVKGKPPRLYDPGPEPPLEAGWSPESQRKARADWLHQKNLMKEQEIHDKLQWRARGGNEEIAATNTAIRLQKLIKRTRDKITNAAIDSIEAGGTYGTQTTVVPENMPSSVPSKTERGGGNKPSNSIDYSNLSISDKLKKLDELVESKKGTAKYDEYKRRAQNMHRDYDQYNE